MENLKLRQVSFKDYLFRDKQNKWTLLLSAIVFVLQFSIFKYFYPFASYLYGDSFSYLEAAEKNWNISFYMIGYSKFLRLFNIFTTTDFVVAAFQYLAMQCSSLLLLFTIFYFYNPGKVVKLILLCFMIFNPLFLHMGNTVSSDALFAALSLIWFSLLLWIIHRPSLTLIIWHTVVIFIAFTFRYNALIYLFIAAVAFMLSELSVLKKFLGIGLASIVILLFVLNTGNLYQKLTGTWQYSPFAGWQLANNAMYTYRYVDSSDRKPVPSRFQKLDNMICAYFDSTRDINRFPAEKAIASSFYMWSPSMPLCKYRDRVFKEDTISSELKTWASMGPLYKDYGLYIISHYPVYFVKHFLWPNAQKYYSPPLEFLENYNSGRSRVNSMAQTWFQYKSREIWSRTKSKKISILIFYPILSGVTNVVMLLALISFIFLGGYRQHSRLRKGVLLGATMWLANAGFTILASSPALRFQAFPIFLSTVFMSLLIDWLVKMTSIKEDSSVSTVSNPSAVTPA